MIKSNPEANIGVFSDSSVHDCPIVSLVFRQKAKHQRTEDHLSYRLSTLESGFGSDRQILAHLTDIFYL